MMVAVALRGQGLNIEMSPLEKNVEDIKNYATTKGIKGIIIVKDNGIIKILDLKNGTTETTDIKSLTGGAS